MNIIKNSENKLAKIYNQKHCILTGRAATALWISFSLISPKKNKVIIPNLICPSVLYSIILAKCEPIFADVLDKDSNINPQIIMKIIGENRKVGAVVVAHLYGFPAIINEIKNICLKKNILIIKDLAQTFIIPNSKKINFSNQSDISVISFGPTKVLDIGGGGGLLTDNDALAIKARKMLRKINIFNYETEQLKKIYKNLYYFVIDGVNQNDNYYKLYDIFPNIFKNLFINKIDNSTAAKIDSALTNLEDEIKHRVKIFRIYQNGFSKNKYIILFDPKKNFVPWRFSFRVNKKIRNKLLSEVRKNGYDISSWYPGVRKFSHYGRKLRIQDFLISEKIEKEIVNLWVTKKYSKNKAYKLVKLINKILKKIH